jgi:hypothetical protein
MSFKLRYSQPGITWTIFAIGAVLTALAGAVACIFSFKMRFSDSPTSTHPAWYCLLFVLMVIALVAGAGVGDLNHTNFQVYYDTMSLSVYENVDPSVHRSHQMMDVGQITFARGVGLDPNHAMAFHGHKNYCVTPIIGPGGLPNGTVDFWAVGTDCCSGGGQGFHCGEYQNSQAHGGVRVVDQEKEAFFRLAVQQAAATYSISAPNPVMITWMQDPVQELNDLYSTSVHYYVVGLYIHLIFQIAVVALAICH